MSLHCGIVEGVAAIVHTAETGRARFDEACREVIGIAVGRMLDIDGDRTNPEVKRLANRRCRALVELQDMIRAVTIAVEAGGEVPRGRCPWTFHLLRMLEVAGQTDLARTDEDGQRVEGRDLEIVRADFQRDIESMKKRARRISTALTSHDPYVHRPVDELELELESTESKVSCLQQVSKISPDRNHLKAAVIRMVMRLNALENESALADFIGKTDEWRPQPCPTFSADDCYDNVRKILSRAS